MFTVYVPYKPWKNRRKPWKNRHQTVEKKKSAPKIHHFFTVSFSPFTSSWVWVLPGRKLGPCCLSFLFSTDLQCFWTLAVQILRGLSFVILWGWGGSRTVKLFPDSPDLFETSRNSVCSQFLEGLFAILEGLFAMLFEVLLIEIQEDIHHFAGWEEGGVKGHKNCEQTFCEQTGVS